MKRYNTSVKDVEKLKEVYTDKNLYKDILYKTWYKLYMLQNYNISMDMFKGANLRWSSIITYLTHIRAIYKGYKYKDPMTKSLVEYIQGLMDSGTEPYPKVQKNIITIEQLVKSGLLTKNEINYIYSSVGVTEENPDTSVAWTHEFNNRQVGEVHGGSYTSIVESLPENYIKPTSKQKIFEHKNTTNPFVHSNKDIQSIYKKAFKLI